MIQTPTTRLVFRSDTTCGSPTTAMLESRVAMKIPTVVTVRTTHLYSKRTLHTTNSIFLDDRKTREYKLRPTSPRNHRVYLAREPGSPFSHASSTHPSRSSCQDSQEIPADV